MSKTADIKLNGNTFTIHRFTIGEMERVTEAFQGPSHKVPFALLRIALERAEPKPDDVDGIEITADELRAASDAIIILAGLQQPDANPPKTDGQ